MAEAEENGDLDFISRLPDELLSRILSSLKVEDAVRAKLLSRRWRHLFPESAFLCFHAKEPEENGSVALRRLQVVKDDPEMFVAWVDTVMQQFKAAKMGALKVDGHVESMHFRNVDEWIRLACLRKTEGISLIFPFRTRIYTFPFHLLHASNFSYLRSLSLEHCSLPLFSASAASINSVRKFKLRYVCCDPNIVSFEDIASYFPNLQNLTLVFCGHVPNMGHLCDLCGRLLHLRSLEVMTSGNPVEFQIDIPYEGLNCVIYVNIVSRWSKDWVENFLSGLPVGVPHLDCLSVGWIDWTDFRFPSSISTFRCLKYLFLRIDTTPDADLQNLIVFLRVAPLLQVMTTEFFGESMEWSQNWLEEQLVRHLTKKKQLKSSEVHHVHAHLKKVTISRPNFCYGRSDVELIICLLNTATSLEEMILCSRERENAQELQRALLAHCSPKVKISLPDASWYDNPSFDLISLYGQEEF